MNSTKLCKIEEIKKPLEIKYYANDETFDPSKVKKFVQDVIDRHIAAYEEEQRMIKSYKNGTNLFFLGNPVCPHCAEFRPKWKELEKIHQNVTKYSLVHLNCTDYETICKHFKVEEYPTIVYSDHYDNFTEFTGESEIVPVSLFLRKISRNKTKKAKMYKSGLVQLDQDTFFDIVEKNVTFIQYELPGCHYCDVSLIFLVKSY